jgi:hypothetical protein
MDSLFRGSCDTDVRFSGWESGGEGHLNAIVGRRAWESRCLATGEGLLLATDATVGVTCDFLRIVGVDAMPRADATAAELLRLEGRVVGEGDPASLLVRFAGVVAADCGPFPSSHGSFFTAVRGVAFP